MLEAAEGKIIGSGGPVADDPGAAKSRLVAVGVDSGIDDCEPEMGMSAGVDYGIDAYTREISTSVEECTVCFVD